MKLNQIVSFRIDNLSDYELHRGAQWNNILEYLLPPPRINLVEGAPVKLPGGNLSEMHRLLKINLAGTFNSSGPLFSKGASITKTVTILEWTINNKGAIKN